MLVCALSINSLLGNCHLLASLIFLTLVEIVKQQNMRCTFTLHKNWHLPLVFLVVTEFITLCCSHIQAWECLIFLAWKGFFVPEWIFAFLLKPEEDINIEIHVFSWLCWMCQRQPRVWSFQFGEQLPHFLPQSEVQVWPHLLLPAHLPLPTAGVCFFFLCSRPVWINFCSPPLLRKSIPKALDFLNPSSNVQCEYLCGKCRN